MNLRFGYGTNGFSNHRLADALEVIADLGYQGVALTLDHAHLDPFARDLSGEVDRARRLLVKHGLAVVVETGARYLLDAKRKHAPTLLDEDDEAKVRIDFLKRAIDIAVELNAEAVSFWSGVISSQVPEDVAWQRLVRNTSEVVEHAAAKDVRLGFEPEPGMLVDTLARWQSLSDDIGETGTLGLTLDIGHCCAVEPHDVDECVRQAGSHVVNVQIEDMRRGVHEHLEFGAGEIDFPPVLQALKEIGYTGLVSVELPRHCHAAPDVAARSIGFLLAREWLGDAIDLVRADSGMLSVLFPTVGRHVGRANADDARVRLLLQSQGGIDDLYRYGDSDEKRAVLLALPQLDDTGRFANLTQDALRSNDSRLVAAALGSYARHLPDEHWRQGVLKAVFMHLPLSVIDGLEDRADAELGRMLDGLRREREAAGRTMPDDAIALLQGEH